MVGARIAEIMAVGAKRAEVTAEEVLRELKALGFSDIGKVVRWRPEVVYEEIESEDEPSRSALSRCLLRSGNGSMSWRTPGRFFDMAAPQADQR
jgi:hypothetical protein